MRRPFLPSRSVRPALREKSTPPRIGAAIMSSSFDLTDVVVVGAAAVLVAGLVGWGAVSNAASTTRSVSVAAPRAVSTPKSMPTRAAPPVIDVIASSQQSATAFAAGVARRVGTPVKPVVGGGYFATAEPYSAVASKLDRDARLVIVVPATDDAGHAPLAWQAPLTRTVGAIRKAAPRASVLLVGPLGADAQAGELKPVRDAVLAAARETKQHYVDGVTNGWVGEQVDAVRGLPTADALRSVGTGLGGEAKQLLAG